MPVVNREVVLPVEPRARLGADHRARRARGLARPTTSSSSPRRARRCVTSTTASGARASSRRSSRGRADRLLAGATRASSGRSTTRPGGTRFLVTEHRFAADARLGPAHGGAQRAAPRCAWPDATTRLGVVFAALADPTRRQVLRSLSRASRS